MSNVNLKIEFNAYYSEKRKTFDGGIYEILQYLKDNNLKDVLVRLDVDKKNENSWEEVDFFCKELSIKELGYEVNEKKYPKYKAFVKCAPKTAKCLIKILVEIGKLGNGGHSYTIFIGDKSFGFDGDGADHISSINNISLNTDLFSSYYKLIDIYNKGLDKKDEDTLNENKSTKIILTESELQKLIKESVKKILVKNI